jgi:tight adherence protein C
MTSASWGALLGGLGAVGLLVMASRVLAIRRGHFEARVLRHLVDLPQLRPLTEPAGTGPLAQLLGPGVRRAADLLDQVVGGTASVRRRLERAGSPMTVAEFRTQQVIWGLVAFAGASAVAVMIAIRSPGRLLPLVVLVLLAAVAGALSRENRLTAQVRAHERQVLEELPAVAELLALSVAAGEGPVAALERVVARSHGSLSRELAEVLAAVRTGTPVGAAFDAYSARSGVAAVSRFASGVAVAVERGTPLADVLHAQAGDVREAHRRVLIESGARREVAMMMPVVFLVLPTTVMFAFWPGVVGLQLVTP